MARWVDLVFFALFFLLPESEQATIGPSADLVYLPRVNFAYTAKQYAGYLNANDSNLFYWYLESQGNPSSDPLLVWFSSYPGCSSLIGLLNEIGPFRPSLDGMSLYENVFAWNKVANLLFIDSPAGVGWSTANSKPTTPTDDQVAQTNYQALLNFITKFPQYNQTTAKIFLASEGYGSVFVLTLAKLILDNKKTFPDILKGVAIGNGALSAQFQTNAMIHTFYHYGLIGTDTWDNLMKTCNCPPSYKTTEDCDFYTFLNNPTDACGKAVNSTIQLIMTNTTIDATNIYRDCYTTTTPKKMATYDTDFLLLNSIGYFPPGTRKVDKTAEAKNAPWPAKDPAHTINYDSTDALLGFSCWGDESTYLSQSDVQQALHVNKSFIGKQFTSCASNFQYNQSRNYTDMGPTIQALTKLNLKMLFYNGDADLEYNFLGIQWLIDRNLAKDPSWKVVEDRGQWLYRGQTAGFAKRYTNVDELTVKGAGRNVPMDRGGPALQMINNFIKGQSYSTSSNIDVKAKNSAGSHRTSNTLKLFMTIWALSFLPISSFLSRML